ncbi:MAG: hypothetical protein A2017_09275 [Lentisphaerae bacterium GWF2_44_16]|nr:MAG: hypothetical protein A2017_09275 [Lentisphaerae bacterium GWF2_44_16]
MSLKEDLLKEILAVDNAAVLRKIQGVLAGKHEENVNNNNGFMSVEAAQEFLGGISRGHLWNLRRQGLKFHKVGGRVVFLPDELRNWVFNNRKEQKKARE